MRSRSKRLIVYFFFGCCVGFMLECTFRTLFESESPFIGHKVTYTKYYVKNNAIFNNVKFLYNSHSKDAANLSHHLRILCWVATQEMSLQSKAQAVKNTWGGRCNVLVFFSSSSDKDFPTIKLDAPEGYDNLWYKTRSAWEYVYDHFRHDADWFIKCDDDTFVIVENLRAFLSNYKTTDAHYFGRHLKRLTRDYNSGGAGYVLSKEALISFVSVLDRCNPKVNAEDVAVATCLSKVGIHPDETRDEMGREIFHPFAPDFHLIPGAIDKDNWLHKYNKRKVISGPGCCSSRSVAFHYVTPKRMYLFHYYLYQLNN